MEIRLKLLEVDPGNQNLTIHLTFIAYNSNILNHKKRFKSPSQQHLEQ